jgi:uncharacterized membrane protein (DUF485 family)
MKKKNLFWVMYFTFFLILATPMTVKAYVDPATLTYVIQIVAGLFIAGGVAIGVYWRKIKKLFTRDKTSGTERKVSEEERAAAANAAAKEGENEGIL